MDDENFVNINENYDAGDERFVELRGRLEKKIKKVLKIYFIDFFRFFHEGIFDTT